MAPGVKRYCEGREIEKLEGGSEDHPGARREARRHPAPYFSQAGFSPQTAYTGSARRSPGK